MLYIKDIFKSAVKCFVGSTMIRVMVAVDTKPMHGACWLFHGSTVDVFTMCSIAAANDKFREGCLLATIDHKPILDRFKLTSFCKVIFITSTRAQKYRKFYAWINSQEGLNNIQKYLNIPHCVTNKTIYELIKQDRLNYRNGLTFQMGLPKNTQYTHPSYTHDDYNVIKSLFVSELVDLKSIALINPVAYTHGEFDEEVWQGIYNALTILGFKCFWNIAKNHDDNGKVRFRDFSNCIEIPSDLVPLASSLVGLCVGGMGGGFDLLLQFCSQSKCVLVHKSSATRSDRLPDYPLAVLREKYQEDCGRSPMFIISVSDSESSDDIADIFLKGWEAVTTMGARHV